ncbi:type II toxin-antitoxin system VapC family toxin [Aridibaculum aurantiacum]|uniref:type II toxin-antitoxin system VapC family toxin n=1 Tax=Aridibaculum aurantiacum TaxID=2810307 RepID=UPI001A965108|nr:type II toxin-antitoxin system VapC family toxin [Aridibaculum aurantiacum]
MAMILSDTSVILYFLKGMEFMLPYKEELFSISVITEIELLGVKNIETEDLQIRKALIEQSITYPFTGEIKHLAIKLKQEKSIRIPDAIIAATAIQYNLTLLTTDKDFASIPNLSLILLKPSKN